MALHAGAGSASSVSSAAFPLLATDGTSSAPSYANSTGKTGLYYSGETLLVALNQVAVGGWTSGQFSYSKSSSGTSNTILVANTSNTASSHAVLQATSTGASGGNAFSLYATNAATWSSGVQNNASGKFSISQASAPGTNDYLSISASTAGVTIHGTNTNDSAAAGFVGEYIESVQGATAAGTSATWTNLTSISLTAGDWDVTGLVSTDGNGSTFNGDSRIAISVNTGATTSDHVNGSNVVGVPTVNTAGQFRSGSVSSYRLSLSATTTVFLKTFYTYTGGPPQVYGRASARRVR